MRLLSCCLLVLVGCSGASFETVAPLDTDPGDDGADSSTEGGADASDSGASDTAGDADAVPVDGDGAPPCDVTKTPAEASCVLRDDLGIFVSTDLGNDGNPGTRAAPVKTLAKALALAKDAKKRVYACAEQFNEAVTAPDGVSAYGGLDCKTGWTTVIGQSKVVSTTSPTLRVRDASVGVTFVSFDFHAPKGTGVSGSSVAAVVASSKASFELCAFTADVATAGVEGDAGAFGSLGDSGKLGQDARTIAACPDQPLGGKGGVDFSNGGSGANACDLTTTGFGPKGYNASLVKDATCGLGTQFDGGSGVCGLLVPGKGFLTGLDKGCPATDGANGGAGKSLGAVTADGLAAALPGGDGIIGGAGGGGGGGGAGLLSTSAAAGGGGGGAGGQGGGGGRGGKPGGSSVAFLSFNSEVTLTKCDLHAGDAGNGGNGGTGSTGGDGGKGAEGGKPKTNPNERGCRGGDGARGGTGGGGGGGGGGSSIGILVVGSKPKRTGGTVTLGTPGSGGNGGMGVTRAAKGDEGAAVEQLNL